MIYKENIMSQPEDHPVLMSEASVSVSAKLWKVSDFCPTFKQLDL